LIAERAAVTALQRAFSRGRYILRALATRSQLDLTRRLTGNLTDATGSRRVPADVPANRRAALLQNLLRGMAELFEIARRPGPFRLRSPGEFASSGETRRSAGGANAVGPADIDTFRQRALVLAEEAIRIDPAAALLRQAATELQRAAGASDAAARSQALAAAATAAASEARLAHADAPLASPSVAPALSGAFADAMRRER
jgi:hypothetical protein